MTSFRRSQLALSLFVWMLPVCWHNLPQGEDTTAINPHDLRSAFLLREGVANYQGHATAEFQAELRRHFDAVLTILELNTPQAIEFALDRLEASQGKAWSPTERERHREELLASRSLQLARLRAYRDRGLFPQNEGHADHAVPIFVDNHGTACAVGHLMRLAGWEEEVAEIQIVNNLVYVPDAADSSVAEWALTAGVTLEEAALIQPAYGWMGPPPIPDDAVDITQAGTSVVIGDLRYTNFRLYTPTMGVDAPQVNIPVSHSYFAGCFCSIIISPSTGLFTSRTDLRFADTPPSVYPSRVISEIDSLGDLPPLPFPSLTMEDLNLKRAVIQFDVEVVSPVHRIATLPQASSLGLPMMGSPNEIGLYVTGDMAQFSIRRPATMFQFDPQIQFEQPENFLGPPIRPIKSMTVVTEIFLRDGESHQAQHIHFDVMTIPEPTAIALLTIGVIGLTVLSRRRGY